MDMPDGQYTSAVYTAIKEARYPEAIRVLTSELGVGGDCCLSTQANLAVVPSRPRLFAQTFHENDLPFLLEKRPDLREHNMG